MSHQTKLENTAIETAKISLTQKKEGIFEKRISFSVYFRSATTETLIFPRR
jgi:hypothetical protein